MHTTTARTDARAWQGRRRGGGGACGCKHYTSITAVTAGEEDGGWVGRPGGCYLLQTLACRSITAATLSEDGWVWAAVGGRGGGGGSRKVIDRGMASEWGLDDAAEGD